MALNFLNQESLPNGLPVWHFEDPTDKARFSTLDPGQAFTLGAPTPSDMMNPNPQVAAPAPLPDLRLAQNIAPPLPVPTQLDAPQRSAYRTQGDIDAAAAAEAAGNRALSAPQTALEDVAVPPVTPLEPVPTAAAPSTGYTAETLGSQPVAPAAAQPTAPTPLTVEQLLPEQTGVVAASDLERRRTAGTAGGYTATGRTTKGVADEDKKTLQQQAEDLYTSQLATAEAEAIAKRDSMLLESSERQLRMGEVERERQAQVALATKQEEEKQATLKRIADDEQAVTSRHPSMKNVWKSGGTVGVAALFAGLGELGAGLTRSGRNTALDMINRAVDQNLNEQAAAIASDKDALNGRKNAYAMYLADGHDPKFARLAAQNLALKLEEDRLLDASVQKSLNAQGVEYMSTVDGIKAKRLQVLTDLAKLTEVSKAEKYTAPRAGGVETEEQALARTLRTAKMRAELGELQGSRLTATERAGVVKDRVESGAAGGDRALPGLAVGHVDKSAGNVLTYMRALKKIQDAEATGDSIELSPSGLRSAGAATASVLTGPAAAKELEYGTAGAKVVSAINDANSGVYNPTTGVQGEAEYARAITNAMELGDLPAVKAKYNERMAESMQTLSNALQQLKPAERAQIVRNADPETRAVYERALSGNRPSKFRPDADEED